MDAPADQPARAVAPRPQRALAPGPRAPRRRRPTGEPPPLPYHLQTSGVGWLVAAVALIGWAVAVFARDLHAEFTRLLPAPPRPISIQRWSARRVGAWACLLVLAAILAGNLSGLFSSDAATKTSLNITHLGCGDLEPLWLEAQSVPSASLLPCVRPTLAGWKVADVAVNNGRTVVVLDNDRAGAGAVVARLTGACDPAGGLEVASAQPGVRRFERVNRLAGGFSATWYDQFDGGCVTYALRSASDTEGEFANEAPLVISFASRASLRQALAARSGGRLRLDPEGAR